MQRQARDVGETLIEIVISIVLLSIAVTMIILAVASSASFAVSHRTLTQTDVALKRAAEAIKAQAYVASATPTYSLAALTFPTYVTVTVTRVACLSGTGGSLDAATAAASQCTTSGTDLQLVTITAAGAGTDESTTVVKRRTS